MTSISEKNKFILVSDSQDPYFNLAAEEYLLRHYNTEKSSLLFVYQNAPCVVLGKHQNVFEEIQWKFIHSKSIPIVRRVSGGGTVYHDLGNINFTFIDTCLPGKINRYDQSTGQLVEALNAMNIPCYLDERNAIRLNNHNKISGSAQFTNQKNILSHCTLLIDSDLNKLNQILQINPFSIESKSSKSVRSTVENIFPGFIAQHQSMQSLRQTLSDRMGYTLPLTLSQEDLAAIQTLQEEKYQTTEWNYHKSATCKIHHQKGLLVVEEGMIQSFSMNEQWVHSYLLDHLHELTDE